MPSDNLPRYHETIANPLHDAILGMELKGVSLRFYPLRAKFDVLQKFCDDYLNFGSFSDEKPDNSKPPFSFRPALPFVILMVLDYDRLEVEGASPVSHSGAPTGDVAPVTWLRQHEFIFGVPLEWYSGRGRKRQFKDWAMTSPFMYLDHPISIWIGREAFGWPKTSMRIPRVRPIFRPGESQRLSSFQIPRPSGNPEHPEVFQRFVEIYTDSASVSSAPQVSNPISVITSAISGYLQATSALMTSLAGFRIPNLAQPDQAAAAQQMVRQGLSTFAGSIPALSAVLTEGPPLNLEKFAQSPFMKNNITLKQFCDAREGDFVCYQALMQTSATVNQLHGAGLLFNPLSPDPTGGTVVKLHVPPETGTHEIIETLGLETDGFERTENVCARILKPYYPFWFETDLEYVPGKMLSWRGMTTEWSQTNAPGPQRTDKRKAPYVRIGSGVLAQRQNHKMTDVTIRVLPFKAKNLDALCQGLNDLQACAYTFKPASDCVLLSVIQFTQRSTSSVSVGSFSSRGLNSLADTEVVFAVPAKCAHPNAGERTVLLQMLGFVGAEWNAFSDREKYGRLSLQSSLLPPREDLLEDLNPATKQFEELFYVSTSLCRALNENEETRLWPILDFVEILSGGTREAQPELAAWLGGLGLGMVTSGLLDSIALKQFRDGQGECTDACYQALVEYSTRFSPPADYGWIDQRLALRVYQFETVDIVKYFGLETSAASTLPPRPGDGADRGDYQIVVPHNPFWIKTKLSDESARNLCCREGAGSWREVPTA